MWSLPLQQWFSLRVARIVRVSQASLWVPPAFTKIQRYVFSQMFSKNIKKLTHNEIGYNEQLFKIFGYCHYYILLQKLTQFQ